MSTKIIKYEDGKRAEIQTVLGINHGAWIVYRKDGSKDWERFYSWGRQSGPERSWYANGLLEHEFHFAKGKLNGTWKTWHKNGQLKNESIIKNGNNSEYDRWYSISGEVVASMSYNNGKLSGTKVCTMADETTFESEQGISTYEDGKFIGFVPFDVLPEGYGE